MTDAATPSVSGAEPDCQWSVRPSVVTPGRPCYNNLGTLARLQPRKRIYELILAFSELLNHSQDFHLHIGGDKKRGKSSDYIVALDNLVNKLNLQDKVTFYGNVEQPELWYPKLSMPNFTIQPFR